MACRGSGVRVPSDPPKPLMNAQFSGALLFCGSPADAHGVPFNADDVATLQLPSATAIDLAVHRHVAVYDGLFHISAGVEEPCELHELTEADGLIANGDFVDRSFVRHPGRLTDHVPPAIRWYDKGRVYELPWALRRSRIARVE